MQDLPIYIIPGRYSARFERNRVCIAFRIYNADFCRFSRRGGTRSALKCRARRETHGAGARGRGGECVNCHARSVWRGDAQAMRGLRSARRGDVREGRRARAWSCVEHAAQRCAGNAWFAKCAAWTMWANCKRGRRGAWGEGMRRCNGTCGAARRGASGRRVLGARAGA